MALEQAEQIVKELVEQGGPATLPNASGEDVALEKTHVIALIAYLQRLGTDIYATESDESTPATDAASDAEADPDSGDSPDSAASGSEPANPSSR